MSETTYVVTVERRRLTNLHIEHRLEYLVGVSHDPYGKGGDRGPPLTEEDPSVAREFKTLAAAEVLAAMVCGTVQTLDAAVEAYNQRKEKQP